MILSVLVLLVLAGHLPFLATTLEDLDSFNFALGLHDFDPRKHQPHPPGYPVIIALGRMARPVAAAFSDLPRTGVDARALALVSALAGALAVLPLFALFRRLDAFGLLGSDDGGRDVRALAATVLTVGAPLVWFTAARPMSDLPGLLLSLIAQALLVAAWVDNRPSRAPGTAPGRGDTFLALGAMAAALAIGARSQAVWLVAPILTLALVGRRGAGATRAQATSIAVFLAACVAWGVPLLIASGGLEGYLGTLADQAGEDFAGVEMVWTTPSARMVAFALRYVFLDVWGPLPLGILVTLAAAAALAALALRAATAILVAGVLWLPYFVFHLLFQETATSRYDLPLVPPLAWLATQGLLLLPRLALPAVVSGLTAAGLAVTMPALARYAADGSPIGRAMGDMAGVADRPAIAAHHVFMRAFEADGRLGLPASARRGREWLEVIRRWRARVEGGEAAPGPLWFVGEPRRTDAALVDPVSRAEPRRYDWTFDAPRFIRGTRPDAVVWHSVAAQPGWFLGDGWALTPELAGIARRDAAGLARGPLVADVRRREEAAAIVIGGRHLGGRGGPVVRFDLRIDDRSVDAWESGAGAFLRVVTLPAGTLSGSGYARLTVRAAPESGTALPPAAIEQFDLQSEGTPAWGFDAGWHEAEFDRRLGRPFRWTSKSATLRIVHAVRDVEVRLVGESPLKYFDRAPVVVVRAGGEVLKRDSPADAFDWRVRVPAATLRASGGVLTIDTDLVFRPGQNASADARELGLRLFDVMVAR